MPTSLPDSSRERDTPSQTSQNSNSAQAQSETNPAQVVPLTFPGCPTNFTEIRLCFDYMSQPSSRVVDGNISSSEGSTSRKTCQADECERAEEGKISTAVLVNNECTERYQISTAVLANTESAPATLTDQGQIVHSTTSINRHKPLAKSRGVFPKLPSFSQPSAQTNSYHAFKEKDLHTTRTFSNNISPHQPSSMCDMRVTKRSTERGGDSKLSACPRMRSKSDGRAHKHRTECRYQEESVSPNVPLRTSISTARLDYHHSTEKESAQGDTKYIQYNEKTQTGERYNKCHTLPEKEIYKLLAANANPTGLEPQTPPCPDALLDLTLTNAIPISQVTYNTHRLPSRDWSRTKGPRSIDRMFVDVMKILVSLENHQTTYSTPSFDAEEDDLKAPDFFTHLNQTANQWRQKEDTGQEANNGGDSSILIGAGSQHISQRNLKGPARDITDIFDRSKLRLVLGTNEDDEYVCQCCLVKNHHRSRDNNNCHYFFDDEDDDNDDLVGAKTTFNAVSSSSGSPEHSFGSNENLSAQVNEDPIRQPRQRKELKLRDLGSPVEEKLPPCPMSSAAPGHSNGVGKLWKPSETDMNLPTQPSETDMNLPTQPSETDMNFPIQPEEVAPKLYSSPDEHHSIQASRILCDGQFNYYNKENSTVTRISEGDIEIDNRGTAVYSNDVDVVNSSRSTKCGQDDCLPESSRITRSNWQPELYVSSQNKNAVNLSKYEEVADNRLEVGGPESRHTEFDRSVSDKVGPESKHTEYDKSVTDKVDKKDFKIGRDIANSTLQVKGTQFLEKKNVTTDLTRKPLHTSSCFAQCLDLGSECDDVSLAGYKQYQMSQLTSMRVTGNDDSLATQKQFQVMEHSSKKKRNITLEELGTYFEYPNPVISSCSTGKAATVSSGSKAGPMLDTSDHFGSANAEFLRARPRSLSPVIVKVSRAFNRPQRSQAPAKKSLSDIRPDLINDNANLGLENINCLDIHHLETHVSHENARILQEDARAATQSDAPPVLATPSRTCPTSGDDHSPIFCLEIVNTASVRKKCKQLSRNQESFSSIMSREMKNQHSSWLVDAAQVECSQFQRPQTEVTHEGRATDSEFDYGRVWEIEEQYQHLYCNEREESCHSKKLPSCQSESSDDSQQRQDKGKQYQCLEEHHTGAPIEARCRLLHFMPASSTEPDLIDVEVDENDVGFDDAKDNLFESDESESCSPVEQASLVFREVASYEQSRESPRSVSSPSSGTNCRTDWEDLYLNDDLFTALPPGKSCSLVNTREIARAECRVTEAMTMLLGKVNIKRYPSYPDLTSLISSDCRFLSGSSPELIYHSKHEHFVGTRQIGRPLGLMNFDSSQTFLRGNLCSDSPVRTRTLINKPPVKAVSLTHLPSRIYQNDEYATCIHSRNYTPDPWLLCGRYQDLATCCPEACCLQFSKSETQKTTPLIFTRTVCAHSGFQRFSANIDDRNRVAKLKINPSGPVLQDAELPSPPDYSFSGNSWDSASSGSQTDESSMDEINVSQLDRQYVQSTSKASPTSGLAVSDHRLKLLRAAVNNECLPLGTHIMSRQASTTTQSDVLNDGRTPDNSNLVPIGNTSADIVTDESQRSLLLMPAENGREITNNVVTENPSQERCVM